MLSLVTCTSMAEKASSRIVAILCILLKQSSTSLSTPPPAPNVHQKHVVCFSGRLVPILPENTNILSIVPFRQREVRGPAIPLCADEGHQRMGVVRLDQHVLLNPPCPNRWTPHNAPQHHLPTPRHTVVRGWQAAAASRVHSDGVAQVGGAFRTQRSSQTGHNTRLHHTRCGAYGTEWRGSGTLTWMERGGGDRLRCERQVFGPT